MNFLRTVIGCLSLVIGTGVQAHEFWIEPQSYVIGPGEPAIATLHVGQDFKAPTMIYIPGRTERFEVIQGDVVGTVTGRIGDNPALNWGETTEGLMIVVHETNDSFLTYTSLEKFQKFVDHKAMDGVMEAHAARGLPDEKFREQYRRFAKSLIAVGDGAGTDRPVGLRTEIVALNNPYALDGPMQVQVLFEGAPRSGAQVELFEKAPGGEVNITLHTANADGIATLPVRPGHSYLADSVKMVPLEPTDDNVAVWESLWAALTFAVPQ